jgi:hypothetical protein
MMRKHLAALQIERIFFAPTVAVARVGGSHRPMEAFTWAEDPRMFGAGQTVIVPATSLEVLPDGSIDPYLPLHLRFKDAGKIRPVCPFFELHVQYSRAGITTESPLTIEVLKEAGLDLQSLSFSVEAANRKASRRTGDDACSFSASLTIPGDDHKYHQLRASSPIGVGEPLVLPERPIPLGWVQVIRPIPEKRMNVDLGVIRVRFTPAAGEVYGPPSARKGFGNHARPVKRGQKPQFKPREYEIVPLRNRILNSGTSWDRYDVSTSRYPAPDPAQTYDGDIDASRPPGRQSEGWGVVDDTCDAILSAHLTAPGKAFFAHARVLVGPPDYAPDCRPFYSLAEDLADRDPESVPNPGSDEIEPEALHTAVVDLFRRVLETSSLVNLDVTRDKALLWNSGNPRKYRKNLEGFPLITAGSMRPADRVLSQTGKDYVGLHRPGAELTREGARLAYTDLSKFQHDRLAEPEYLIWFLMSSPDRLKEILRPPYHWLEDLPANVRAHPPNELRDARWVRDLIFDMRMPPYHRDSDSGALSLTRRQWDLIHSFVRLLAQTKKGEIPEWTHLEKHLSRFQQRRAQTDVDYRMDENGTDQD